MSDFDLTEEEKKAIRALKRLAKIWPDTLWLFSASGTLCVMRYLPNGKRALNGPDGSGMDPNYIVARIYDIPNDGGDW